MGPDRRNDRSLTFRYQVRCRKEDLELVREILMQSLWYIQHLMKDLLLRPAREFPSILWGGVICVIEMGNSPECY